MKMNKDGTRYSVRGNAVSGYYVDLVLPNGDRKLGMRQFKYREDAIDYRSYLIDKNAELDAIETEHYNISDEEFEKIRRNADEVNAEIDRQIEGGIIMDMELENALLTKKIAELQDEVTDLQARIKQLKLEQEEAEDKHRHTMMNFGATLDAFFMQQIAINDLQADLAYAVVNGGKL